MAYQSLENLPETVRNLPQGAQQIFMAAFNACESDGLDEQSATSVAWNSVKNQYEEKGNGQWQAIPEGGTEADNRERNQNPLGSMSSS